MQNEVVRVNQQDVLVKEYEGQRVVTFKDIDRVHERPEGTAGRNFRDNKVHFIEGEDYFKICPDEIRRNKIMDISSKLHQDIVFLTESGYLMLVKSFTDDLAWQVQRQLVKSYFNQKANAAQKTMDKPKKEKLPSVNMMVKNIKEALHDAGVDSKYIAAEVVRIYSDSGYPVNAPVLSDVPKLWDCTNIAKELGIYSESGRPHDKAVSAIIQKLDIFTDEIVRTAYSRNGHDGVTVQYKGSVLEKAREWLEENGYPSLIEYRLANGSINKCKVCYREVA